MDYKALSELLYPDVKHTPEYYEQLYPKRNLPEGAKVTRFAPSPTGFVHMGSLFVSLVDERLARQSSGVFFLRVEDTDKNREVEGGVSNIIKSLSTFDINFDEGVTALNDEKGNYGPYKQSDRMEIYKTFAKLLVEKGCAYPCFCSEEDLERNRKLQEENKLNLGYYGEFATHRNFTLEQVKAELDKGKTFVLRVKAPNNPDAKVVLNDLIKGAIEMPENNFDMVLVKSDGLPTYHFAHAVDDHLMRTTHVIRGDEWLSTAPLHLQLFEMFGWEKPNFAHISPIMKIEGESKRKLSKRKDPEASVSYFHEEGFPSVSVVEYLLNLANSNFEDWRKENPAAPNKDFRLELDRMSVSGALFDMVKLTDISKERISYMTADEVYALSLEWAEEYDRELAGFMKKYTDSTKRFLGIERGGEKPRKDIAKWSEVRAFLQYIYDEIFFEEVKAGYSFPETVSKEEVARVIGGYINVYNENDDKTQWFDRVKEYCETIGYSKDVKAYKKNPESFKGHVGDVAGMIRIAVANRKNTPDLYEIMQVLGRERVLERLKRSMQ